jgi:hypothetical protein
MSGVCTPHDSMVIYPYIRGCRITTWFLVYTCALCDVVRHLVICPVVVFWYMPYRDYTQTYLAFSRLFQWLIIFRNPWIHEISDQSVVIHITLSGRFTCSADTYTHDTLPLHLKYRIRRDAKTLYWYILAYAIRLPYTFQSRYAPL